MDAARLPQSTDDLGSSLHARLRSLFAIHRSITGDGLRETLNRLRDVIDLTLIEVPTGTPVLDWQIPQEWRIRDAYVADASSGERLIDYHASNLHVVNYSQPVHQRMTFAELDPHLHSLPEQPTRVPYRTSFFRPSWGFCLTDQLRR
ncbi:MAG: DUF2172 domain-containing protein, partial [Planctomycetales bacterium]|nr:DUF2172 domain-containing protein [Planctomycetales bacterium]